MKSNQLLITLILTFGIFVTGCSNEDIKSAKHCTYNGEPVTCESKETLTTELSGSVKAVVPILMNQDGTGFRVERTVNNLETIGHINNTDVDCPAGLKEGNYKFLIQNGKKLFLKKTYNDGSADVATMMVAKTEVNLINETTWLYTMTFDDSEINAKGNMTSTYNFNNTLTEVEIESRCVLSPK